MKNILIVFVGLIILSCQSKKGKLTFYIENGSRVDTLINFKVFVDKNIKIDTMFKYAPIAPNYDTFIVYETFKDSVSIQGITSTGAGKEFKIKFDKNAYVFLTYIHDSLMTKKERMVIEQMKKELNGYDASEFFPKKAIREKVQYTEPLLY